MPAARTTITLPEELNSRLEAIKSRINVSAICQEAIEREVIFQELMMKTATKRDATIARLKVEREKANDQWQVMGKRDGLEDATDLAYEDFKFLEVLQQSGSPESALDRLKDQDSFDWLFERINDDEFDCPEALIPSYITGWLDGVIEFWGQVKDEVES